MLGLVILFRSAVATCSNADLDRQFDEWHEFSRQVLRSLRAWARSNALQEASQTRGRRRITSRTPANSPRRKCDPRLDRFRPQRIHQPPQSKHRLSKSTLALPQLAPLKVVGANPPRAQRKSSAYFNYLACGHGRTGHSRYKKASDCDLQHRLNSRHGALSIGRVQPTCPSDPKDRCPPCSGLFCLLGPLRGDTLLFADL